MKFNVIKGKTLKEYKEKYNTFNGVLLRCSKKDVSDFAKEHHAKNLALLNKKNWWLIDDTYYEIPKPPRLAWFKSLNKGWQALTYVVLTGLLASAVILPIHFVKLSKMVNEDEWYNALNEVTDVTRNRNYTFIGEFDDKLTGDSSAEPTRIKEKVYVAGNQEHIFKTRNNDTSESCYKIIDTNEVMIKDKVDGIWSDYKQTFVYNLPSYELQELSMLKIMYSDFKFNNGTYTYTQEASESDPEITINVTFKNKRLININTKHGDRANFRKFDFFNYGCTSLNL